MQAATLREYAEPVILRDGASLTLRAVRPSDKTQLADLFGRLSPQSIRYRAFVLDVIQRVSALVEAVPEVVELELNPLKVLPQGALAVDGRMRVAPMKGAQS